MTNLIRKYGRILRAPENFLQPEVIDEIHRGQLDENRRGFLRKSLLAASATLAAGTSLAAQSVGEGDPNILVLPEHSRTLGKPVAAIPTACRRFTRPTCCAASRPA